MKQILIVILSICVLASCSKGKFKTVPQVTINSFGPDVVKGGETFELNLEVTDAEGDLQDTVYIARKRFTGAVVFNIDTLKFNLDKLQSPNYDKIELKLTFGYGKDIPGTIFYQFQEPVDRGLVLGIIVRDKAGNKSEYVESKQIVLKKF